MWLTAFFVCLTSFVATAVVLAVVLNRYLRRYREVHGPSALLRWQWRRDGRVQASYLRALSTRQELPELERARLNGRLWVFIMLGALALTCVLGLLGQGS
jgi:hypothetical protein